MAFNSEWKYNWTYRKVIPEFQLKTNMERNNGLISTGVYQILDGRQQTYMMYVETSNYSQRLTDRRTIVHTYRQIYRQTNIHSYIHTERQTNREGRRLVEEDWSTIGRSS